MPVALDSVLNQSLRDFEVTVIEDGRIAPVIRDIAKDSSREKFLSQLYKGVIGYAEKVGLLPDFIGA